ncbi:MAG: DUF364 domain-containing protein [Bacteroidota bacterium]|nr:DUF364 domain-containing protein [Bacteroidota bacterium]
MIIEQTFDLLKRMYGNRLDELIISDVRIGHYLTAVRLSDESIGTASSLSDEHPFCARHDRDFGDFTPLKIKGRKVIDLLETKKEARLISSLKTAVLSAVSSKEIASGKYPVVEDHDPIQLLNLKPPKTITVVGAFQSYIRTIAETENRLYVLELNESALPPDQKKFYIPAEEYRRVLPESDIVLITGQTLVNRTIDDLLSAVTPGAQVAVTGPSSGILPDVLFTNKVTIVGTLKITRPEILFDIVSEGGMGYHLFEYCARKICILKPDGQKSE